MSWNIWLYAEIKGVSDTKWVGLSNEDFCTHAEDFLPSTETIKSNIIDDYDMIQYDDLSDEVKSKWSQNGGAAFREVPLETLRSMCHQAIDKFESEYQLILESLGMVVTDDGDDVYVNAHDENARKQTPLTYPINKVLLERLHNSKKLADKARGMLGILDAINTLAGNAWETVCRIRIILVGA